MRNTNTNNKPFDKEACSEYDTDGKNAVSDLLKKYYKCETMNHADEYKTGKCGDLFAIKPSGEFVLVESEVKNHWLYGREKFPYKTIRFPQRKQLDHFKHVKWFFIVSKDLNGILMVSGDDIRKARSFSYKAANYDKEEQWIEIDCLKARFYSCDEHGDWNISQYERK